MRFDLGLDLVRAPLSRSYQHDHTPVENPSVLVVTTG